MSTAELVEKNLARFLELHERMERIHRSANRYNDLFMWIRQTRKMSQLINKPEILEDSLYAKAVQEFRNIHQDIKQSNDTYSEYIELHDWLSRTKRVFPEDFENIAIKPSTLVQLLPHVEIDTDLENNDQPTESMESQTPLQQVGELVETTILALAQVQEGMNIPFRRHMNNKALDLVEKLLREHGILHFDQIVTLLRREGLKGYPIEDPNGNENAKPLYNAMQFRAREKDRFVNLGENKWSLIKKNEKENP